MDSIGAFLTGHSTLLLLIAGPLCTVLAPFAVKAWHDALAGIYKETGIKVPDSPAIDADIEAVVAKLGPALLTGRIHTPQEAIQVIQSAIQAANPSADTSSVATALTASSVAIPAQVPAGYDPTKSTPK